MKYCSNCGQSVNKRTPPGEDRLRYVCDSCQTIHYQNPCNIVGTIPVKGEKVLLCRRAIEPRKGFWTFPAGFMENGETTLEGAVRETWEEARAKIHQPSLYQLFDLPYINQVYFFYRGELTDEGFEAGPESLEVRLFSEEEIPWDEIAFKVVQQTLKHFFEDSKSGKYAVRISEYKGRNRPL